MVWYLQNSLSNKSVVPTIYVFKAPRTKIKVALSGAGFEKISVGYGWTKGHHYEVAFDMLPGSFGKPLAKVGFFRDSEDDYDTSFLLWGRRF